MTAKYSGGEEGYIGIADESDPLAGTGAPGTWVAPTEFLMAESTTLASDPAMVQRDVYGAGRDSDQGYRTGKENAGGALGLALYPRNGRLLLQKAVGKDVAKTALTADTTTNIATLNNTSVLTLTTGGAYGPPDIVLIDTAAAQECLPVLAYDAVAKTVTVPLLRKAHSSAGTAVHRVAQGQIQPYSRTDNIGNALGTISVEENVGGKGSERYPWCIVGKWGVKAAASKVDVTAELNSGAQRIPADGKNGNPAPTAFDDNDPTWSDLGFEFTDGFLCFPADPTDSGTSALQLVNDGQDWELNINNNVKMESCNDGTTVNRPFPMNRQVDIKFKMLNSTSLPQMYYRFLKKNLDIPFFAFACLNVGTTPAVPVWEAVCFYAPNVRLTKSAEIKGLKEIIGEQIEAKARRANGQEKIYISYLAS